MKATVATLDRAAAHAAISAAAARFGALLLETDDIEREVPGTEWTVAQTAAHVVVVLAGFSSAIEAQPMTLDLDAYRDADFPDRLAACNAATLDFVDHTDATELATFIRIGAQRFLAVAGASRGATACATPWYGPGRTRTVDCLTALALGELTLHGHDIATATNSAWPLSQTHATLILGTVYPEMAPLVVRPDACRGDAVAYEVRLRGTTNGYVIRIADGAAEVGHPGGQVDCVLSVDPVAFLLVIYGRLALDRALSSGAIVATGRRPSLGAQYQEFFFYP